jgi:hypothetical protein
MLGDIHRRQFFENFQEIDVNENEVQDWLKKGWEIVPTENLTWVSGHFNDGEAWTAPVPKASDEVFVKPKSTELF